MTLRNNIFTFLVSFSLLAFASSTLSFAQDEVFLLQEELMGKALEEPEKREMEAYDTVKIRALDKITARTETVDLRIGDMMDFGALTITAKACRKSLPIDQPESASFLQVWEFPLENFEKDDIEEAQIKFSGWMFASSPGLSAMDHPIYDIWVLDCIGETISQVKTDIEDLEISTTPVTPRDDISENDVNTIQTEILSE